MKLKTKTKKKPIVYDPIPVGSLVLSLDTSSSAMGWALGRTKEDGVRVIDFGVVRPSSGWDFARKIGAMTTAIDDLCKNFQIDRVVMEFQSHKSAGKHVQGLAVLGQAQGAVWRHMRGMPIDRVDERAWTKINGKNARKDVRCEHVKTVVPAYAAYVAEHPRFDKGLDAADAIGLLLYRVSL